jgi:hypothetical protein
VKVKVKEKFGSRKIFHTKDQTSSWRVCKILKRKLEL